MNESAAGPKSRDQYDKGHEAYIAGKKLSRWPTEDFVNGWWAAHDEGQPFGEYTSFLEAESERRICPDGGVCGHRCEKGCWRVRTCGPLSGVYPGDRWPASVTDVQPDDTGGSL